MKRRAPLTSSTPLRRTKGLARRTPLTTRAPLERSKLSSSAPPVGGRRRAVARRVDTGPARETTVLLWERAGGRCERCGDDVRGRAASRHHRQPRGMGGTSVAAANSLSNLMLLCGTGTTGCHGWVEKNRRAAVTAGYLVPRGYTPAEVPVVVMMRPPFAAAVNVPVPMYLTDDGDYDGGTP